MIHLGLIPLRHITEIFTARNESGFMNLNYARVGNLILSGGPSLGGELSSPVPRENGFRAGPPLNIAAAFGYGRRPEAQSRYAVGMKNGYSILTRFYAGKSKNLPVVLFPVALSMTKYENTQLKFEDGTSCVYAN